MGLLDIILTVIIQVLFCAGVRVLLSEGMLLHFIRKPFQYDHHKEVMNFLLKWGIAPSDRDYKYSKVLHFALKPFLLCVVCFSSVWGGSVFIGLHGLLPVPLIISCVSTAFILRVINDKVDW